MIRNQLVKIGPTSSFLFIKKKIKKNPLGALCKWNYLINNTAHNAIKGEENAITVL